MAISFLSARWMNLCLITYSVPPALLEARRPPGLELDVRNGQAFISLVAFQFLNTRVLGIPWPGYRHFAELNLRFYVRTASAKNGGVRGVVFLREFVPQRLVAWAARLLYNEPYRSARVEAEVTERGGHLTAKYQLTWAGRNHSIAVEGRLPATVADVASDEHFFKEHSWGFGVDRRGRAIRYRVEHPRWEIYPVRSWNVDLDWASVYGPEWHFLHSQRPYSVILAAGSPVAVSYRERT